MMLLARVEGKAVSTVKHKSLTSWRMLIVQPLDLAGREDGCPNLAIDSLGAGSGDIVIITGDGKGAREMLGDDTTPTRVTIMGIVDRAEEIFNDV